MTAKADKFPRNICIDLTYRCPARCGFCFLRDSGQLNSAGKELSAGQWVKIFTALPPNRNFYLTGGEPFVRKDIAGLVRAIKEQGHYAMLTTNGLLLSAKDLAALFSAGLDTLVVSLHGGREEHDATLGVKGAFEKVRKLASVFSKMRGRVNTKLELWCTIHTGNYEHLAQAAAELAALKPDAVNFNHFEFIAEKDWEETSEKLASAQLSSAAKRTVKKTSPSIEPRKLAEEIEKIKQMNIPGLRFSPALSAAELRKWYGTGAGLGRKGACSGQWDSAWLSPAGEFYSCQPLAAKLGRITVKDPWAAFNGKQYTALRKLLEKEGGFLPACYRCGRATHAGKRRDRR